MAPSQSNEAQKVSGPLPHELAGPSPNTGGSTEFTANRWLRLPEVQERISLSREKQSKLEQCSKEEIIDILSRIIRAKPTDASIENPLCDIVATQSGPVATAL
ncbi:MAG: hypothetical protein QM680_04565 [Luteolibacter sp.]